MGESVYKWKMNLYKVDAQVAGDYLKGLEKRDGEVNPSVIVDESRSESAILHPCFEWNDDKAAENYRIHQAKGVIRNIVVVHETKENEEPSRVRAFVHMRDVESDEPRYIHIETALSDGILKKRLLESAIRELNEFRKKYKDLVELSKVFRAVDETVPYVVEN